MRLSFTLLLFFGWIINALAQPANDECTSAQLLNLGTPPACPSTAGVTNNFNVTNVNATPTTPYPTFSGCDVGGSTDSPAAEVWFTFTPNSNVLDIQILNGLNTPNIVLFSGSNCSFLTPVYCASAATNAGTLSVTVNVLAGQQYYLFVSGGNVNDQANFTLRIISRRDCNPCLLGNTFTAIPPPLNGTYNSGQTVTFCFTVSQWDVTSTVEWLHAIEISPGPGWDLNSLIPTPPPSCDGNGEWGFYDSWVGSNTGQTFGPGFAYDSSAGGPFDGNPGNNWGDGGGGCANIGTTGPPVTFCWTITALDCPPNSTGSSLSMDVQVWSDGDSGSWTQTGCNSGTDFNFLASTVCCNDNNPAALRTNANCPGASNGSITAFGGGAPGTLYDFYLFNSSGNIVNSFSNTPGPVNFNNLPVGTYSVLAVNVISNCSRSTPVVIMADPPPTANITLAEQPCPGENIQLQGSAVPGGPGTTYAWTGPGGFTSNQQNPPNATVAGTYSLVVTVGGCPSPPATFNAQFVNLNVVATANPATVCPGSLVTLTGSGASTYTWVNTNTGQTIGSGTSIQVPVNESTTYEVTGTDVNGCTDSDDVIVLVNTPPTVNITTSGTLCAGQPIILTATGANTYVWADNPTATNPRTVNLTPGFHTFNVTGTSTATGCSGMGTISFFVAPAAVATISPTNPVICAGQSVVLTASGGNSYNWSNNPVNTNPVTVSPPSTTSYTVTVTSVDGCTDTESVTVVVNQPLPAPVVSCGNITPNSVQFLWMPIFGATSYNVVVNSGPAGVLSGSTYTVSNLSPGQTVSITVSAQGSNGCGGLPTTFSCTSLNCPPVDVTITGAQNFCLSPSLTPDTLGVTITGGMGGTTVWSGPGIINSQLGVFDPIAADTGAHQIIVAHTIGQCIYRDTVVIHVDEIPTADFQIVGPSTICLSDTLQIAYTGTADTSATYNWNFDGGTAIPGTGQGPHQVVWTSPGSHLLTLVVSTNACVSDTAAVSAVIEAPLSPPVISCGPNTTTSASFTWADVIGATGYAVTVLSGQSGTQSGNSYTVTGLQPGEAVTIEVTAQTNNACGTVSAQATCNAANCPAIVANIDNVADICLDGSNTPITLSATVSGGAGNGIRSWSGPGIIDVINGVFDPAVAGAGLHTITLTYAEGPCTANATTTIQVFNTPTADFTVSLDEICINNDIIVTYTGTANPANATFNWNFNGGTAVPGTGPGPHNVSWPTAGTKVINLVVTENGCTSPVFSQTVDVSTTPAPPVINCNSTTSQIIFSWAAVPGATGYDVNVITGPSGVLSGTTYTVTGLSAGDVVTIEVEAILTGNPCGNIGAQQTCIAEDCPAITLAIDPVADICLTANMPSVDLNVVITGGSGNGTAVWSGPGITNAANGIFNPNTAGLGTHTINLSYTEGNCNYASSVTIVINAIPSATFTAVSPVCVGENSTIIYTGNGGPGATYTWGFSGGSATPGTGQGPHDVNWSAAGTQAVSLTVTENGCSSQVFSTNVVVEAPLAVPVILCNSTNTSVTFSWGNIPGATSYIVTVLTGPSGTQSGNTYTVNGLNPGDMVEIEVVAQTNNVCGSTSAQQICSAQLCPTVTLTPTAVGPLCADAAAVTLQASATGGAGGGTFTWSGPGVSQQGTNFVFNPATAGAGQHILTVNYSEGICPYSATLTVTVNPVPVVSISVVSPVCINELSTVTFTGQATAAAIYNWNFNGGTATPGSGAGPHQVSWATAGTKTVTLSVNDNGCIANTSATVQVNAPLVVPVINCQQTTSTSVVFSWAAVPGATGYQVIDVDGPAGTLTGTTYSVSGLSPNQSVTIQVVALGSGPCGNSTGTGTCIAQDCPSATVALSGTNTLCAGQSTNIAFDFNGVAGPYSVVYTVNGGTQVTASLNDGGVISLSNLSVTTTINVVSFTPAGLPDCTYPGNASFTVTVNPTVNAGNASAPARICVGAGSTVTLSTLISGADPGGQWSETSANPSSGGAFNAGAGVFNTTNQQAGTYRFVYTLDAAAPCPDDQTEVLVIIEPAPVADAGADQTITCNQGLVALGGTGSSSGPGITYLWTASDPNISISNPNSVAIEANQAGTYTLTVSNDLGCSDTDEVVVNSNLEVPTANVEISKISCFQANDGAILVQSVAGGTGPYTFSLNGGAASQQGQYTFLGPDNYSLLITDQNGCSSELLINLTEPEELIVQLVTNLEGDNRTIELGDSVRLEALYNAGITLDTIIWEPDSIAKGNTAVLWVSPATTTQYSVTIIDENGCSDSDNTSIFVRKQRPVYIPNGFSPNNDGVNDIFYIHARDNQVRNVKSFLVFNRWGESMVELHNFRPNDPAFGWDGRHRGAMMNPGVYAYFIEIEFTDGEVIIFKGDVSLVK